MTNPWVKAFLIGALGTLVLAWVRVGTIPRSYGGLDAWQILLFAALVGGIGGLVYRATEGWRERGPSGWAATFAVIGALAGSFAFFLLIAGGAEEYGLSGAPLTKWVGYFFGIAAIGAVLGAGSGLYFRAVFRRLD